jgi:hypothetical protein
LVWEVLLLQPLLWGVVGWFLRFVRVARGPPPPTGVRDDDGVYQYVDVDHQLELPVPVFCRGVAEEDGREVPIWLSNCAVAVAVVVGVVVDFAWRNTPSDGRPEAGEAHY